MKQSAPLNHPPWVLSSRTCCILGRRKQRSRSKAFHRVGGLLQHTLPFFLSFVHSATAFRPSAMPVRVLGANTSSRFTSPLVAPAITCAFHTHMVMPADAGALTSLVLRPYGTTTAQSSAPLLTFCCTAANKSLKRDLVEGNLPVCPEPPRHLRCQGRQCTCH